MYDIGGGPTEVDDYRGDVHEADSWKVIRDNAAGEVLVACAVDPAVVPLVRFALVDRARRGPQWLRTESGRSRCGGRWTGNGSVWASAVG